MLDIEFFVHGSAISDCSVEHLIVAQNLERLPFWIQLNKTYNFVLFDDKLVQFLLNEYLNNSFKMQGEEMSLLNIFMVIL